MWWIEEIGSKKEIVNYIKGGTFIQFVKEQLNYNNGNDIKDKFSKQNFSANNKIEKVVFKNIGKCSIKSNTNDINSISQYITYGIDNI